MGDADAVERDADGYAEDLFVAFVDFCGGEAAAGLDVAEVGLAEVGERSHGGEAVSGVQPDGAQMGPRSVPGVDSSRRGWSSMAIPSPVMLGAGSVGTSQSRTGWSHRGRPWP